MKASLTALLANILRSFERIMSVELLSPLSSNNLNAYIISPIGLLSLAGRVLNLLWVPIRNSLKKGDFIHLFEPPVEVNMISNDRDLFFLPRQSFLQM